MRTLLALDTSSDGCSVAVNVDGVVTALFELAPRQHTRKLLPMVQRLMAQLELSLSDIDAIAFGCGPGSFAGLRIAAGVAQGLAYGSDLPVIEVSTLDALALQSVEKVNNSLTPNPVEWFAAVAIDARMSEIYWSLYHVCVTGCPAGRLDQVGLTRLTKPTVISPECVAIDDKSFFSRQAAGNIDRTCPWVAIGDGWNKYQVILEERLRRPVDVSFADSVPRAEEIAHLAYGQRGQNNGKAPELAAPVYLRDEITWQKLPGR
ncbi:MAG: tRNA (adenosine(37)-N6)-threonylcarbamoyltransferase complex dimerization subunit type 1 TsaB [Gammaproteobacteria bacterium]|nr:MAG: tRNA (adenosine(37)-N6)-threonylcarbamoyltransferase complex dimerization subunit type 1 TsaB [Gammaproteobacteria bacterium]